MAAEVAAENQTSVGDVYLGEANMALRAGFVQKFEILGLAHLLHLLRLQIKIHEIERRVLPALKA